MEVVVEVGAGLDVHKKTVVVCCLDGRSSPPKVLQRTFGTFRHQLEELRQWLRSVGCTTVAMESTGVYWIPVYRVLEGHFEIVLGNARHMANVPGRKTDQSDAHWIADLLRFGLIRKNFVPARAIFDLRLLTRARRKLVGTRTAIELRVEKLLQITNCKLSSVASEIFGVSGRAMLKALAAGPKDPTALAELARGKLRKKRADLAQAFNAPFTADDRRLLALHLSSIDDVEKQIAHLTALIEAKVQPYDTAISRLDTIPGINRVLAIEIVAETAGDVSCWPSQHHFASWCGVAPGNRESAGKRRRARVADGRPPMKNILTQAATSAGRTVGTYLSRRYRTLCKRRGERHAVVAVAHELATAVYFVLLRECEYRAPAPSDPLKHRNARRNALVRELQKLGFEVTCSG